MAQLKRLNNLGKTLLSLMLISLCWNGDSEPVQSEIVNA